MNIIFTINKSFLLPFAVTLHTLLVHNRGEIKKITVLIDEMPKEDGGKIEKILSNHSVEFKLIQIQTENLSNLKTNYHFKLANYYRLLIPDVVTEDKVIYLDADLLVLGSLRQLWGMDLGNNFLAAVCTIGVNWHPDLGVDKNDGYFNSGVMVLNLKKWRAEKLGQKVIDFIRENPKLIWFVDQCGLNALTKQSWLKLPLEYNVSGEVFEGEYCPGDCGFLKEEIEKAKKDPQIVHFTGTSKPWNTSNQHPYKKQFWKYLKQTPYARTIPEDFSIINFIKYLTPKYVRSTFRLVHYTYFPSRKSKKSI